MLATARAMRRRMRFRPASERNPAVRSVQSMTGDVVLPGLTGAGALPSSVVVAVLKELGSVSGNTPLQLGKASSFAATVTGTTVFQPSELPSFRETASLIVTQDATGGRAWSIEGITWIGPTPTFKTTAKLTYIVSLVVVAGQLYGVLGLGGAGVPPGGLTGTALLKKSGSDNDLEWGEAVTAAAIEAHLSAVVTEQFTKNPTVVNVKDHGAKGDVKTIVDAKISNTSTSLTSTGTTFTSADVGKKVNVVGAGAEVETTNSFGAKVKVRLPLIATILSASAGAATLSVSASATVSGASCTYGTDDTAAFAAAVKVIEELPTGTGVLRLVHGANYGLTPVEGGAVGAFKPSSGMVVEGYGSKITAFASTSEEPKVIYCAGATIFRGITLENTLSPNSSPIGVQGGASCATLGLIDCTIKGFGFQGKAWTGSTTRVVMKGTELEGNQAMTVGSFGFNHAGTTGAEMIVDDCYIHHTGDNGEELHCHGLYLYQEVAFLISRTRFNHAKGRYSLSFGHAVNGSQAPAFCIYSQCWFGPDHTASAANIGVITNGMTLTIFDSCVWGNTLKGCVQVAGDVRFGNCVVECADSTRWAIEFNEAFETEKTFTANTKSASAVLENVSEFKAIIAGSTLTGAGIPAGTTIVSYDPEAKTITMSANATATATAVSIVRNKPSATFRTTFVGCTFKTARAAIFVKGTVRATGCDFSSSTTSFANIKVNEGATLDLSDCTFWSPAKSAGAVEAFANSTTKMTKCRLDPTLNVGIGVESTTAKFVLLENDFSQTGAVLSGETPAAGNVTAALNYGSSNYTGPSTLRGTATLAGTPGKVAVTNSSVAATSVIVATQRSGTIIKTGLKVTPEAGKFTIEAGEASTAEVAWQILP